MPWPISLSLAFSVLLYLIALAFPGFYVVQGTEEAKPWIEGFWLLVFGLGAVFQGLVAWLANPLIFAAWFAIFKKNNTALVFSVIGLGFALSFLFTRGSRFHDGSGMQTITGYAIGYWLWVASLGAATVCALLSLSRGQK